MFTIISIPFNLYNTFSLINLLNENCIRLDTNGLSILNYSKQDLEYIIINNKKSFYMINDIIDNFWVEDCLNYCNNLKPCSCSFNLHSKIKSDILFKISLDKHGFDIKNIDYIKRYNAIIDKTMFFEKQFNDFQKLKECDLGFYYKTFPNIFNKYNNFSNFDLIKNYNKFND